MQIQWKNLTLNHLYKIQEGVIPENFLETVLFVEQLTGKDLMNKTLAEVLHIVPEVVQTVLVEQAEELVFQAAQNLEKESKCLM